MTRSPPGARLYAATYNELGQAARAEGSDAWMVDYLGRLRLDAIAFHTIVMPLNFITDGTYFLDVSPQDLLRAISRTKGAFNAPLEIRARKPSFDESLLSMFQRDEHLHGIVFDSITDPLTRNTLASVLRRTETTALDDYIDREQSVPRAICALMRNLLHAEGIEPGDEIFRLERGWSNWRAVLGDQLELKPFLKFSHLAGGIESGYIDTSTISEYGLRVFGQFARMVTSGTVPYHSDIRLFFSNAATAASDEKERRDVYFIERFAEVGWDRAIALDYSCSYAYEPEFDDPASSRLEALIGNLRDDDEFLPPGVFRHLGLLPTEKFQDFTSVVQDDLFEWWSGRNEAALRRVLHRLARELDREGLSARESDQKVVDMLVSIPSIGLGGLAAWAVGSASGLGAPLGAPVGSTVGALGTLATVYATKYYRARPKRRVAARLIEYCLAMRPID